MLDTRPFSRVKGLGTRLPLTQAFEGEKRKPGIYYCLHMHQFMALLCSCCFCYSDDKTSIWHISLQR